LCINNNPERTNSATDETQLERRIRALRLFMVGLGGELTAALGTGPAARPADPLPL